MERTDNLHAVASVEEDALVCRSRLTEHEQVVEENLPAMWRTAAALKAIRDGKLYRYDYSTFEEYVRQRWHWSRRTAYDYIAADGVRENVRTSAHLPTIGHAVLVSRLPPELQEEHAPAIAEMPVAEARRYVAQVNGATASQRKRHAGTADTRGVTVSDMDQPEARPTVGVLLCACGDVAGSANALIDDLTIDEARELLDHHGELATAYVTFRRLLSELETGQLAARFPGQTLPISGPAQACWTEEKVAYLLDLRTNRRLGHIAMAEEINAKYPDEYPVTRRAVSDLLAAFRRAEEASTTAQSAFTAHEQ